MNLKNVLMSTILLAAVTTGVNAIELSNDTTMRPADALPLQVICVAKDGEKMKDSGFLVGVDYETVSSFSKSEFDELGGMVPPTRLALNVDSFTHQRCPFCYDVEANLYDQAFYSFHIDGKNGTLTLSGEGMHGEPDIVVNLDCSVREE